MTTLTTKNVPPTKHSGWRDRLVAPDDPARRAVWNVALIYAFVVAFSGVWILLRSGGVGGAPFAPGSSVALTLLFTIGVAHVGLRTALTVRRGGYGGSHGSRFGWVHTAIDLMLVSATVRVTGGAASSIWLLFFVIVVAESVLEASASARWVRFGVAVALLAAMVPLPLTGGAWMMEWITRLVFLFAASMVAQRLRINAEREKSELAALRAEMSLLQERAALSREIHDGVGNALAASVLRLEVTARVMEKQVSNTETPTLLREEAQILRGAMNDVRDWTFFSKPWGADEQDAASIADRLVQQVERLSRRTNLAMRVIGAERLGNLQGGAARLAVLRIMQEALTNAAKYARATEVLVIVEITSDALTVTVRDNGAGFDPSSTAPGVGMASMRERAAALGGTLTVESKPGAGTDVCVRLPRG